MIEIENLEKLLKDKKISQRTYDRVKIAKQTIERKYNIQGEKYSKWNNIFEKINLLDIPEEQKLKIKDDIFQQESKKYRKAREKQTIFDYEQIAIIGRGAFGEVHVCREKKTGQIVAVKKIKKDILILKNQVIHVRNEQLFMSKVKSSWIVELKASFQEGEYLYLVMEYLPGGDFMNLLIKKDILPEDEARFYTAELILAIESIHKFDCIHRDIKPDNILIDKTGHIKLSDFGLAKVSDKIYEKEEITNFQQNKHQKNYSCVGTAYYVAPEVLNKEGYGKEIDWWSVGVIFFEMLVGYAPFCSKQTSEVCHKVLNWKKYLKIPKNVKVSKEAKDLIWNLITNSNQRLGLKGADEIKQHPFFKGVDWENIRNTKAPFIPNLKNDYDTKYFEKYEIEQPFYPPKKNKMKRKDIEYIGYTYKECSSDEPSLLNEFQNSIVAINYVKKKANSNSNLFNMDNDWETIEKKNSTVKDSPEDNKILDQNRTYKSKIIVDKKILTKNQNNTVVYKDDVSKISKKVYNKRNNFIQGINNNNYPSTYMGKTILKTEPNNTNNNNFCYEKAKLNKLNVIKLPNKRIKEKINKKILIPENGYTLLNKKKANSLEKAVYQKNFKNLYLRYSPNKNIMFKKYPISKGKLKKNLELTNRLISKSFEKNSNIKKNQLKELISHSQEKKYSFKGLLRDSPILKKQTNLNNLNIANTKNNCCDKVTDKYNYIYKKKIK